MGHFFWFSIYCVVIDSHQVLWTMLYDLYLSPAASLGLKQADPE